MPTRLLHVIVPQERLDEVRGLLEPVARQSWHTPVGDNNEHVTAVLSGHDVDSLVDNLEGSLSDAPNFLAAVTPVEALVGAGTVAKAPPSGRPPTRLEKFFSRNRLSTEELYEDIEDGIQLTASYVAFVVTSAVIAALGMQSGQTAVVIGAMVIAPFLAPAMAMALAATVGDFTLGRRASIATLVGILVAFLSTVLLGFVTHVDPSVHELAARTVVGKADIGLALASGVAGVIAFCSGLSASLVGVMIAVALVPPLAAAGLLIGAGEGELALGALLLFVTNLVCINVAGIATFLFQGLPPKSWRMTTGILMIWVTLLAALGLLISIRFVG